MDESFDIVIAGGGPVGAALALGLRASGLNIVLLDARAQDAGADDGRTIALAHGSRLILERLGVWPHLAPAATPINHISITQRRGLGRVELHAHEARVPALGYVVGYSVLQQTLAGALADSDVRIKTACAVQAVSGDSGGALAVVNGALRLTARLVVIADGGGSLNLARVKIRDYHQSAVVCDLASGQPHQNRAFECFTPDGPLALLPTLRGWSLVWTVRSEQSQELAALDDAQFCRRLQAVFGGAVGAFSAPGPRRIFPLALKYAVRPAAERTILIGNAAQMLHPVAGQGLNLGLRDAWELARSVVKCGMRDPGSSEMLNAYFSQRHFDRNATILFTDSLIRLFCNDIPLLNGARGLGLAAVSVIPAAKNFLARRMMFGVHG